MVVSTSHQIMYEMEARELVKNMSTVWDEYDYFEQSIEINCRVPKIQFPSNLDVEAVEKKLDYVKGFAHEKFIRKYEVTYRDKHYLFDISVDSYWGCVKRFWLTVYGLIDGIKAEQVKILTERL